MFRCQQFALSIATIFIIVGSVLEADASNLAKATTVSLGTDAHAYTSSPPNEKAKLLSADDVKAWFKQGSYTSCSGLHYWTMVESLTTQEVLEIFNDNLPIIQVSKSENKLRLSNISQKNLLPPLQRNDIICTKK